MSIRLVVGIFEIALIAILAYRLIKDIKEITENLKDFHGWEPEDDQH